MNDLKNILTTLELFSLGILVFWIINDYLKTGISLPIWAVRAALIIVLLMGFHRHFIKKEH